jgi:hypothetical protein
MLRYDTPADASASHPVRKLLVMVLFMGIRDRATAIRFRRGKELVWLTYEVDGTWYDMVPPPTHFWPDLLTEVRGAARLIRPDRGGWWDRTRSDDPEAGWLTFRVAGQDQLYRVQLNADELWLDPFGEPVSSEAAVACLVELCPPELGIDAHLIEFPYPPDAPRADV